MTDRDEVVELADRLQVKQRQGEEPVEVNAEDVKRDQSGYPFR
jgi:hypothetical protein